jgi:hypothetical protein
VPPDRRGQLLARKIAYDLSLRFPVGVALGMKVAIGAFALFVMGQTLAAGHLLRRRGRPAAAVLPYLELVIPCSLLLHGLGVALILPAVLSGPSAGHPVHPGVMVGRILGPIAPFFGAPATLLKAVLAVAALAGVLRGWPGPLRLALYAAWLAALLRVTAPGLPWYADAPVYAGVLAVLAYYWERRRRQKALPGGLS